MSPEQNKRRRRTPRTPEEVAEFIQYRQLRQRNELIRFKRTWHYRSLNIFNVVCFFVYFELVFCYLGPCRFTTHQATRVVPNYGDKVNRWGQGIIADFNVTDTKGSEYIFVVYDYIELPAQDTRFEIGHDFVLNKKLKAVMEGMETSFRLFSASPVLFLCFFSSIISIVSYLYNLNENTYSLTALSVVNFFTLLGIIFL